MRYLELANLVMNFNRCAQTHDIEQGSIVGQFQVYRQALLNACITGMLLLEACKPPERTGLEVFWLQDKVLSCCSWYLNCCQGCCRTIQQHSCWSHHSNMLIFLMLFQLLCFCSAMQCILCYTILSNWHCNARSFYIRRFIVIKLLLTVDK